MCFTRISTSDQSVISKMLEALNLKNNAETRYRCQVSVHRTIGPLVLFSFGQIDEVPELFLTAVSLQHDKTGAQHLHIARQDENNTFR